MAQDNAALRKRTQIAQANRTMFMWIAIASALVGAALVVSIFLFQQLTYNEKVLGAKQETVTTLDHNLSVVDELSLEVQALDANAALMSVKANPSDQALQVVLDALPSEANSLALGASLQNKLLANIDGDFTLDSLQVVPVNGVESLTNSNVVDASAADGGFEIAFTFSGTGNQEGLSEVLDNLERSIRTIVVTRLSLETQADGISMSIQGHAFYQPAVSIELTEETVQH